jgi:hypothetical protein
MNSINQQPDDLARIALGLLLRMDGFDIAATAEGQAIQRLNCIRPSFRQCHTETFSGHRIALRPTVTLRGGAM